MADKTLQYFIDEVSKEFTGSYYFTLQHIAKKGWPLNIPVNVLVEAAERYATYKAKQACIKQRDICAEHAEIKHHDGHNKVDMRIKYFQSGADNLTIDKDSIRNAPLST